MQNLMEKTTESYVTHLKLYLHLKIPAFLCDLVGIHHMFDELSSHEDPSDGTY